MSVLSDSREMFEITNAKAGDISDFTGSLLKIESLLYGHKANSKKDKSLQEKTNSFRFIMMQSDKMPTRNTVF